MLTTLLRVGLIEWMKNTIPLKEFLQNALSEEEKKPYGTAGKWHSEWLSKYGKNNPEAYKAMYRYYAVCPARSHSPSPFFTLSYYLTITQHNKNNGEWGVGSSWADKGTTVCVGGGEGRRARCKKYQKLKEVMILHRKASRTEVEKEYRRKVACIPWDLLRRAFMQLASSPEAFLTLRSHFVQTMASMSLCQYVLGIGDRHLSNFMVDTESGGIIGIDFGHAFGTATQVSTSFIQDSLIVCLHVYMYCTSLSYRRSGNFHR